MEANPTANVATPAQPYGEIFDRGYQHYTGPRLGRAHAIRRLVLYSIKRGLGIKKKWTSKIMPAMLYLMAYSPALIVVALLAFLGDSDITFTYSDLNGFIQFSLLVFAAGAAPEMLSDDRRENVLLLYFARPLARLDYLAAKVIALAILLATMAFGPPVLLFLGKSLLADNPISSLGNNIDDLGRIAVYGVLASAFYAAIGLGIASYTNRKGVAGAIFIGGMFVITGLANALYEALDSSSRRYLIVLSPIDLIGALDDWIFGSDSQDAGLVGVDVSGFVLVGGVLAVVALAGLIMYRRYLAEE